MSDPLTESIALLSGGWEVTLAPAKQKAPVVTGTTGKKDHRRLSSADVATWVEDGYTNVALVMPPGVIGLDVDHYTTDSGRSKRGGDAIAAMEETHGPLPETWRSTSRADDPISGIRFFHLPGGLEGRESEGFGTGLNDVDFIRCEHRYAIVAPSVHDLTGAPYVWYDLTGTPGTPPSLSEIPHLTHDQADHLRGRCSCIQHSAPGGMDAAFKPGTYVDTHDAVTTFLEVLESPGSSSRYDAMVSMVGRLVYDNVVERDIHDELRNAYADSVADDRRGGREEAIKEYNRAGKAAIAKGFHEHGAVATRPPVADDTAELTTSQLYELPPPTWHIDRILPKEAMTVLYGPPGSGKSFLAISAALALATGERFLGHPVVERARTYYVIGEGARGVGPRVAAWHEHWGQGDDDIVWRNGAVQLAHRPSVDALCQRIVDLGIGLAIFDTVARCTVGIEENSAKEMGEVIANIDRIRSETGVSVMLIHHSGKDITKGSRGTSSLKGAADAEIEITPGRLSISKMKDGEEIEPTAFRLHVVTPQMGFGVTSVVPTAARDLTPGLTPAARSVLVALMGLCSVPDHTVSAGEWRMASGVVESTFYKAKAGFLQDRAVLAEGSGRTIRFFPNWDHSLVNSETPK